MSTIKVSSPDAGDLMTRYSADEAGPANYVVKRDWRREKSDEVRREGDRLFAPKSGGTSTQPYPNDPDVDEAVTLHFTARRDDGKTAYICATLTRLFRFYAFEDPAIYAAGVYEAGIYGTISDGVWLVIGDGFTTENAHRWEARNVAGYAVFNNGINLPVSYHLDDFAVQPIHELREQGIAFVGTIEEIEGILVCCDVAIIHSDYLATVMSAVGYGGFGNGQESHFDRVHYRVLWGDPKSPLRWGASVPGTMTAGSRALTVDYAISSIKMGDAIRVVGAGANGADLLTTLLFKSTATVWVLADKAQTAVADEAVSLQDAATLSVGRYDLLDVSGPILRCIKHQDRLVFAKNTGFVLGEYTGEAALPFVFQTIYSKEEEVECVAWRWTLIDVGGEYLVYAGETEFYRFDLITRRPRLHPALSLCSDLFYGQVAAASQEDVFAVVNGFTKEVWFVFPSASSDKGLALYYGNGPAEKCSTLGQAYASAAMIEKPSATIAHGSAEKWFVCGLANGTIVQYAFDRTGPLLWTRRGAEYNSDLYPGYADFGVPNEKHIAYYLLVLASMSPNNQVTVGFWGVRNPSEALEEQPNSPEVFTSPATRNVSYLHYMLHIVQERIRATGTGNVRIAQRHWSVGRVGGASADRR